MIDLLVDRLTKTFSPQTLREHKIDSVLIHFVDDGSSDRSAEKICHHIQEGFPGVLHLLSRNFGHQAALTAGMSFCTADLVAIIDADLQDPPEVILEMLAKWREGFDVVVGERKKRKEVFLKVACYWLFYRMLIFLSEVKMPLDSGDFCLMDRRVLDAVKSLPERLRFPRGLRAWVGFSQGKVSYERAARKQGEAKYTFLMLYRLATDGIASMSIRVLQVTQFFTFLFAFASLGLAFYAARELMGQSSHQPMAIWFIVGYFLNASTGFMIMFGMYIMSAYLGRTYLEVKGRPTYIVSETVSKDSISSRKLR